MYSPSADMQVLKFYFPVKERQENSVNKILLTIIWQHAFTLRMMVNKPCKQAVRLFWINNLVLL